MAVALSIAGSDSIGGAGIQADVKAMASIGVHAATVITAVTSQNTRKVQDILPLPLAHIASQMDAILTDADIKAAKTGMLYSPEIVRLVSGKLRRKKIKPVVDPVLVAGVGDRLGVEGLVDSIKDELIPIATCVTPNTEEAEALTGIRISSIDDTKLACVVIADLGAETVLVKGGHLGGEEAIDVLYDGKEFVELRSPKIPVKVHGSGCILSAYVAGYLAMGTETREAVVQAKARITDAILFHHRIGKGLEATEPMATLLRESSRYSAMTALKEATEQLERFIPREWIPEVGMNFAYALPHAEYSEDVCALDSRLVGLGEGATHSGCYSFGASRHVARIVLEAMRHDPESRSVINVRYSTQHIDAIRTAGLSLASFDRKREPLDVKTMEWGTRAAIESAGKMPDAIYDEGGVGKEAMIRILGKDPQDVIYKLKRAIRQEVA